MITVRLYAGVKEKAGVKSLEVEGATIAAVPNGATVDVIPPVSGG